MWNVRGRAKVGCFARAVEGEEGSLVLVLELELEPEPGLEASVSPSPYSDDGGGEAASGEWSRWWSSGLLFRFTSTEVSAISPSCSFASGTGAVADPEGTNVALTPKRGRLAN